MKPKIKNSGQTKQLPLTEKELLKYFYLMGAADGIAKSLSKDGGCPDFEKRYKEQSENMVSGSLADCFRGFIRTNHLSGKWEKWLKDYRGKNSKTKPFKTIVTAQ